MTPVDDGQGSDETQVFRPPQNPPTDRAWGAVDDPLHDPAAPPESPDRPVNPAGADNPGADSPDVVGPDVVGPDFVDPADVDPAGVPAGSPDDDEEPSRMVVVPDPDDDAPVPAPGSAEATQPPEAPKPPEPALDANGLTLETKRGTLFHDISLTVRPASLAAIVGPSGTGRSSLLLALTGRMGITAGMLAVAGRKLADNAGEIRALTSVARIGNTIGPEPALTVHESVDESCLLDNVAMAEGRLRFAEACTALDLTLEPSLLIGDIGGERATLLAVALACVRISAVIVVDDIDRGVDTATQYRIVEALNRLAKMTKTGPAIIVSTADRGPVSDVPVIVELPPRVEKSEVPNWPIPYRTQVPTVGGTPIAELPPGMSDANTTVIPVQADPPTTAIPVVPDADAPDHEPGAQGGPFAPPEPGPDPREQGGPFAPPEPGPDPREQGAPSTPPLGGPGPLSPPPPPPPAEKSSEPWWFRKRPRPGTQPTEPPPPAGAEADAPQSGGPDPDAPPTADPAAPEDAR